MRDMSSGFQTEIEAAALSPCFLVRANLDSGLFAVWTGIGDLVYNLETYQGTGNLLDISEVKETQNLEAVGLTLSLSGIDPVLISLALTENYQGRALNLYFGVIDAAGALSCIELYTGQLDVMEIKTGGESGIISVKVESDLIRLKDAVNRFYTPEDQKITYPLDKGFDYVPTLSDKDITWGQGAK